MDSATKIYQSALNLLARREHTRHELTCKLASRSFELSDIQSALQLLEKRGLLSDKRAAEVYIRQRVSRGYGQLKICAELTAKGLDRALIVESLRQANIDWHAVAQCIYEKKFNATAPQDEKHLIKQQRFFASRGFDVDVIRQLLKN